MRKYILPVFVFVLVLSSGCVQQLGGRGIDVTARAEQQSVFASKSTTLFVDVENKDEHPYRRVFVDVFDAGMFSTERLEPKSGSIGELEVHDKKPCARSNECYDEDYSGCGVCYNGECVPSQRAQSEGMSCDKTCQCAPDSNLGCREGVCQKLAGECSGGTPYSKCGGYDSTGTQSYFCDEYGSSYSMCQGPDSIVGYDALTGKDDCGCPDGKVCRGDGTCGAMQECFANIYELRPGEIKTIECRLTAPPSEEIPKRSVANSIDVRLRFRNKLTALPTIEMISEEEHKRREFSGSVAAAPSSYSYRDKALQVDIGFSKNMPLVVREGEKAYMYIALTDIGDGMIYPIKQGDFNIIQDGEVIGNCDNLGVLRPDGKAFPKITCELNLPKDVNYLSNYAAIINIDYSYEYRVSAQVEILK